jgi:hypothetical protein
MSDNKNNNIDELVNILRLTGFIFIGFTKNREDVFVKFLDHKYYKIPINIIDALITNIDLFDETMKRMTLVRNIELVKKLSDTESRMFSEPVLTTSDKVKTPEYIYFIKHKRLSPIKIGKTNDIDKKIAYIDSLSPYGVNVIWVMEVANGIDVLNVIKEFFNEYHLKNDWYDISKDDIVKFVNEYNINIVQ